MTSVLDSDAYDSGAHRPWCHRLRRRSLPLHSNPPRSNLVRSKAVHSTPTCPNMVQSTVLQSTPLCVTSAFLRGGASLLGIRSARCNFSVTRPGAHFTVYTISPYLRRARKSRLSRWNKTLVRQLFTNMTVVLHRGSGVTGAVERVRKCLRTVRSGRSPVVSERAQDLVGALFGHHDRGGVSVSGYHRRHHGGVGDT